MKTLTEHACLICRTLVGPQWIVMSTSRNVQTQLSSLSWRVRKQARNVAQWHIRSYIFTYFIFGLLKEQFTFWNLYQSPLTPYASSYEMKVGVIIWTKSPKSCTIASILVYREYDMDVRTDKPKPSPILFLYSQTSKCK